MEEIYLKSLDITIKCGELIGVIGPNGSGKSILLKKICGRLINDDIYINNKCMNNFSLGYKKNNIVCVFDDNIYNTSNVIDELRFYLKKLNLSDKEINIKITNFIEYFNLSNLVNEKFINLTTEDRIFIKILSLLIIMPSIFCIDDLLTYLSLDIKMKILNYIKENNITFICVSSDMEEIRFFDKILIINKGKKELFNKTELVLKNEILFSELGLSLPFIYDLNSMLKSYELISNDHIIYRELVDVLWK